MALSLNQLNQKIFWRYSFFLCWLIVNAMYPFQNSRTLQSLLAKYLSCSFGIAIILTIHIFSLTLISIIYLHILLFKFYLRLILLLYFKMGRELTQVLFGNVLNLQKVLAIVLESGYIIIKISLFIASWRFQPRMKLCLYVYFCIYFIYTQTHTRCVYVCM